MGSLKQKKQEFLKFNDLSNTINAYKRDLEQYFKYLYMEQELKSPSDISLKHIRMIQ